MATLTMQEQRKTTPLTLKKQNTTDYKYRPLLYYTLTFLVTIGFWSAGAYLSFSEDGAGLYMLFMLPGLIAPFLLSLVMIFTSGSAALKQDFVNRLISLRLIQPKMLLVLLLLLPLVVLVSICLSLPFGGSASQFQLAEGFSFSTGFVPVLLLLLLAASFEELGWRGYAFDSLLSRHTFFTASLLFSLLWSFWHFPLVFVKDSYQYEVLHQNILYGINFYVSLIPMGLIISWMCLKNKKSVLAAILFHFVINMSQEILNISQTTKCIETGVLLIVAVAIVLFDRHIFFSKKHLVEEVG